MRTKIIAAGVLLAIGAVFWFPVLSGLMYAALKLRHVRLDGIVPASGPGAIPVTAYYLWHDYADLPAVARLWKPCLLAATALVVAPAFAMLAIPRRERIMPARPGQSPPAPIRANSDLHGHADWAGMPRLKELASAEMPDHGGVVYGTACRGDLHPGQDGGTSPLLRDSCLEDATHGHVVVASGGGKTTGWVIPNLDPEVGWRANVLVNDPSSQVGGMCAVMRREIGQRVVFLGPPRSESHLPSHQRQGPRAGINVLGWIDPAHPLFEEQVWSAVESLGREVSAKESDNPNGMFKIQGKSLQACLLADMMADLDIARSNKTPRLLADRIATPENKMKGLLSTIHTQSQSRMARMLAGTLMQAHPKTFSGFCVEATADLRWLMTEVYADMVSGTAPGSLKAGEFSTGNVCVFLQLGVTTMGDTPQVGRAILNALLSEIYRTDGTAARKYLLLLDEINLFGKLKTLATVASQGRKYGITLVGFWHSLSQMIDTWGDEGAETWRTNASWEAYSAMNTATAKDVSDRCGTYTAIAPSEGRSFNSQNGANNGGRSRGSNEGTTLQAVKLLTQDQAERGLRKDEQIVFKRGEAAPIRTLKAYYFRRPDMAARVGQDQYRVAAE